MLRRSFDCFRRRLATSALYITGDKANENYAAVKPHLDIVEKLEDREALLRNLDARGIKFDLSALEARWGFYFGLLEKKNILAEAKAYAGKQITDLMNENKEENRGEIEKLKQHLRVLKDEYWVLRNYMYGVEESAAFGCLNLPNFLHDKTPIDNAPTVLRINGKPELRSTKSHIETATDLKLIDYTNNSHIFLLNDAALLEQALIKNFQAVFLKNDYTLFSNTDFVKSLVVEGCGTDFNDENEIITLEIGDQTINQLHLTGGASHYAFMAYFTRFNLMLSQFPLKLFTIGRKYQPFNPKAEASLFNATQQTAIEIFTVTNSTEDYDKQFDDLCSLTESIYKSLNIHFRIIIQPAKNLCNYESLRASIQMFSNHKNDYVEIGNISLCHDYLSKRLLLTYTVEKKRQFPKVMIGNVLNIQKLLACLIENGVDVKKLLN